jgi:PAS domain S-box-containing protein
VLRGEHVIYEAEVPYAGAGKRYLQISYTPDTDAAGLIGGWVACVTDITERKRTENALRESEERLRLAQLKTGIGVWERDLRTDKITVTPEHGALFGFESGRVNCYEDFRTHVHPDDLATYEAERDAAVLGSTTFEIEYRIIRPNGQVRWMVTRGGAFYDEMTGQPIRLVGNDADITERKQAELALAERNAQLELASKCGRVGTFVIEFDTGVIKLSPGCASILGLPENTAEISREYGLTLVHPEDLPGHALLRDQAFLNHQRELVAQ